MTAGLPLPQRVPEYWRRIQDVLREHDGRKCPSVDRIGALAGLSGTTVAYVLKVVAQEGKVRMSWTKQGQRRRILSCPEGTWKTS